MSNLYGSIEAGGTKFVCAVGNDDLMILDSATFPTDKPEETLQKAIDFFKKFEGTLVSISVGSFGPIDIDNESKTYGFVTTTPKPHWGNFDMIGFLKAQLDLPMFFTTDVNSSAYGEKILDQSLNSLVYFTIGTGIGAGAIQGEDFIGGISHAEMGHMFVKRHPEDLDFAGVCPYHGDCLEGVAAGPSLEARTGVRGEAISLSSTVWDIQAYYIAQAAVSATLTLRPEKIIFGGGVMAQEHMMMRVRTQFSVLLNDYVPVPDLTEYLQVPAIANNASATVGNFALAKREYDKAN
ncbi:fructokinase ScrK [Pseudolactococcus paracarnosus]|uniref:Fructokinase n=1 Tax=Pseudolactococcus paracarnosus TaxID=2749962 RepID=A0A7L4WCV9_9LACT|nr:fructokinase ScrK [Lactococcus paracarnosus]SPC36020.1 Fructokinase [Lactococcus piscium]MCJ1976662.1 ROK family protein [Lactococcus paracarnosus]MCJ1982547.1 ROK family protein [Lactococcus paracarnosus]MCJ1993588.1 ROK family protein [Lactococcus paracarnosus]MCJ1998726.1 ROK family protein [Lactococcus paracarnosus]